MPGKPKSKHRSGCPVNISLEMLGDRWSLLIVRDLMVRGFRTFKEFQSSGEGIATNILADRLQKLQAAGIITAEVEAADGRKVNYRLTEKGIDLAPVVLELLIWGARHEDRCALRLDRKDGKESQGDRLPKCGGAGEARFNAVTGKIGRVAVAVRGSE
jgi:DNA-binding HxlR family transcriptional regulator